MGDCDHIKIERAVNGFEVVVHEPGERNAKGDWAPDKYTRFVFQEKDKDKMLEQVGKLAEQLPAPSPSKDYADAFDEEAAEGE